jgi:hypothetical protein
VPDFRARTTTTVRPIELSRSANSVHAGTASGETGINWISFVFALSRSNAVERSLSDWIKACISTTVRAGSTTTHLGKLGHQGSSGRTVLSMKLGPGISFSWKRAVGVSKVKRSIAKTTGIPTTRSGRRSKLGRILGGK